MTVSSPSSSASSASHSLSLPPSSLPLSATLFSIIGPTLRPYLSGPLLPPSQISARRPLSLFLLLHERRSRTTAPRCQHLIAATRLFTLPNFPQLDAQPHSRLSLQKAQLNSDWHSPQTCQSKAAASQPEVSIRPMWRPSCWSVNHLGRVTACWLVCGLCGLFSLWAQSFSGWKEREEEEAQCK